MKIVCEHCGAKYSIADDKVAGKIFKIRCKKCDETLEVRGDKLDANEGEESTQLYDYGGDAVWYIVIDGEQQGPLAPLQIGAMVARGKANLDSYVWKEGFDDWKVATQVPELLEVLVGPNANGDEPETGSGLDPDDAPTALAHVHEGAGLSASSLFGDPEPASAATAADSSANNMFSAFEGGEASAVDASMASGSAPMTGQRNENSVLFSLSNLQELATSRHPGSMADPSIAPAQDEQLDAAPAGSASGEGSGLIDIRQLARATSPGTVSASSDAPNDLLAIGGAGASMTGRLAPLPLPHVEEAERRNRFVWLGGTAAVLCIVGLLGYLAFRDTPQIVQVSPTGAAAAPDDGNADPTPTVAVEPAPAAAATPDGVDDSVFDEPEPEQPAAPTIRKPAAKRATRRNRPANTPTAVQPAKPVAAASSAKKKSLDQLMDDVLGDDPSSKKSAKTGSSSGKSSKLLSSPARDDVAKALNGVRGGVSTCKKDAGGVAKVSVTFSGSTGRVSSAKVTGPPFRGTSVGSCIEQTVKRARVPRFSQRSFNVKFPYRL